MIDRSPNEGRLALMLHTPNGHPWLLTMSAGTEIFIGRYSRLKDFRCDGGLIRFAPADLGSPPAPIDKLL